MAGRRRLPLVFYGPLEERPARPRTRGECVDGPRPCPWAGCRYSLVLLDVSKNSGRIWERPEGVEPEETCALDLASEGGMLAADVAAHFDMTHQNVDVTIKRAAEKLRGTIDPELLDGWVHATERTTADEGVDYLGGDFQAAVHKAWARIIPKHDRITHRGRKAVSP